MTDDRDSGCDPYFGMCPRCLRVDGYVNVRSCHWFVCHRCRTRWCAGANLFSSWKHQTQEDWDWAVSMLRQYEEVEPDRVDYQEWAWRPITVVLIDRSDLPSGGPT